MAPDPAETNVWAMHRDFARVDGAEVHDEADLLWFTVPSVNSWLNGASRAGLTRTEADRRIGMVTDVIHAKRRNVQWHLTPSCTPDNLAVLLERRGFERDASTAMSMDLANLSVRLPPELRIVAAATQADVLEWVNTFDRALPEILPRGEDHPWFVPFSQLALGEGRSRLFIGRVGDEAVACSLAFVGGGAVGLYGVGTIPAERGRGYGSVVTAAGLMWGRDRGETLGILHATEMGRPVYARLGFEPLWQKTQWVLPAPG